MCVEIQCIKTYKWKSLDTRNKKYKSIQIYNVSRVPYYPRQHISKTFFDKVNKKLNGHTALVHQKVLQPFKS